MQVSIEKKGRLVYLVRGGMILNVPFHRDSTRSKRDLDAVKGKKTSDNPKIVI